MTKRVRITGWGAASGPLRLGPVTLVALAVVGCSSNEVFDFDRSAPDEFAVVSRAPLSVPPDFNLRPPAPGAPRPQEGTTTDRARATVFGQPLDVEDTGRFTVAADGRVIERSALATTGEEALLIRAGADRAEPGIREIVNRETAELIEANTFLLDRILFWRGQRPQGEVVNAAEEAERLRQNRIAGQPLTEGETPTIERRREGPLEGLFGIRGAGT